MREIQRAFRANQVTHGRSFATSDRTFIGAPVAELVDAQVSGTCDRKVVEVQVLSGAPNVKFCEPRFLLKLSTAPKGESERLEPAPFRASSRS